MSHWSSNEKEDFEQAPIGQITRCTAAGLHIFDILADEADSTILNVVELGTWNGLGSTLCILQALQGTLKTHFYSLECNKDKQAAALHNTKSYVTPRTHLLWGSILDINTVCSEAYCSYFPDLQINKLKQHWFNIDILNCKECPNSLAELPETIDFLLLDGGEFTTLHEFQILLPRCIRYIALDDTETDKCREVARQLRANPDWEEIVYLPQERNGFSIYKFKKS